MRATILVALAASAANSAAAQARSAMSPPARIVLSAPAEVPLLSAAPGDSRPAIDVTINGKGPYRFLIETGAQFIRISDEAARGLGLARSSDDAGEYAADSVNLGTASFKDVRLASLPETLTGMLKANGIDGFLGLPFYRDVLLTLDYPGKRVRVERDSLPTPNGTDVLALTMVNDYYLGLRTTIDGRAMISVLDTQNAGAMVIAAKLADSMAFDGELKPVGSARGVFGAVPARVGQLASDVQIGRYRFPHLPALVTQLPPGFPEGTNVGARILSNFVVSLDQRHGRLRLSRDGDTAVVVQPLAPRPQVPASKPPA
jgi:predicted aspartyl protease